MQIPAQRDAASEAPEGRHAAAGGGHIPVMPRSSVTQNALLLASTRLQILLSNSVKLPKLLYYLHP